AVGGLGLAQLWPARAVAKQAPRCPDVVCQGERGCGDAAQRASVADRDGAIARRDDKGRTESRENANGRLTSLPLTKTTPAVSRPDGRTDGLSAEPQRDAVARVVVPVSVSDTCVFLPSRRMVACTLSPAL